MWPWRLCLSRLSFSLTGYGYRSVVSYHAFLKRWQINLRRASVFIYFYNGCRYSAAGAADISTRLPPARAAQLFKIKKQGQPNEGGGNRSERGCMLIGKPPLKAGVGGAAPGRPPAGGRGAGGSEQAGVASIARTPRPRFGSACGAPPSGAPPSLRCAAGPGSEPPRSWSPYFLAARAPAASAPPPDSTQSSAREKKRAAPVERE